MNKAQQREMKRLPNVVVYETNYKLEWMDNSWDDIDHSSQWLLQLEKEIQPDIIHLNSFTYGALPFKAPKIVMAHSDVFSWWQAVKGEIPGAEWNEYYQRVKEGLENADLVIAPSGAMMHCIKEIYRNTTQSKVIYNGRSRLFYQGIKKPFVFSMGRVWDEAKNIQLLLDAAPKLNCSIKIAGAQQFENNELSSVTADVQFLGKLNTQEIACELSQAAVFVLPAKYEPFGLSALEAAFAGCALVLGDIPSLREIWQDAALYVPTGDAEALADTVNALLQNEGQLHHYQTKATERAADFSSMEMASAYENVYNELSKLKVASLKPQTV